MRVLKKVLLTLYQLVKIFAFLAILAFSIAKITEYMEPKCPDFYQEEDWDVVFFGSSQAYCTFNPSVFDEYGIKTYVRARPQMTIDYTYYYVKDALDVANIDYVVVEIFGMLYNADLEEPEFWPEVCDAAMNGMRVSEIKDEAIAELIPEEYQDTYKYSLGKYHGRWKEWDYSSWESLKNDIFNPYVKEDSDRGYRGWDTETWTWFENVYPEENLDICDYNMNYLEKIAEVCKEHGTKLILVKGPTPRYDRTMMMTNTIEDWAEANNVEMINYMKLTEECPIDFNTDILDEDAHLNVKGAEKVSRYFAEYLLENHKVRKLAKEGQ